MLLSIVIPCYNEKKTICALIDRVKQSVLPKNVEREIVIVDDCSKDGTTDILNSLNDPIIRVFRHEKNSGKGAARKGCGNV